MKLKPKRVSELAREAGIESDSAIIRLWDAGIGIEKRSDKIPRRHMRQARLALGIMPERRSDTEVEFLAAEASLDIEVARDLLVSSGILPKRRLVRVPRHLRNQARETLAKHAEAATAPIKPKKKRKAARIKQQPEKDSLGWKRVGRIQKLGGLTARDVEDIHWILVEDFARTKTPIDPPGVKDEHLLESAVFRPHTGMQDRRKYPTVSMASAALVHALVHNHPFGNGNKRTALVATLVFLDKNGWAFSVEQDELYNFMMLVGGHKLIDIRTGERIADTDREMLCIARWFQQRIRMVRKGEHPLAFRELREILAEFGCDMKFAVGDGNKVNITCDDLMVQVSYSTEGKEVGRKTIHKIRKGLQLDERHGCDSDAFYNKGKRIPEFILKYQKVLDRLAKA